MPACTPGRLRPAPLVPLGLGLGLALASARARACSCAGSSTAPTLAECRSSARVFAGTVAGYEWPLAHEWNPRIGVRLAIDRVWRGDVPARVMAFTSPGCCACGISPTPGTRFLVCDDESGDAAPAFSICYHPLFEPDLQLVAALGPTRPPGAPPAWWPDPATAGEALARHRVLLAPLGMTLLGVLLGRLAHRLRPRPVTNTRSHVRFLGALILLAGTIVATRMALRTTLPDSWTWMQHSIAVWLLVAALVGLVLGYRGQRRPTRHGSAWRGLGAALLGTGLLLVAGFARLHLPVQPADAVACSEARARAYLWTLPIHVGLDDEDDHDRERHNTAIEPHREALRAAAALAPRACTDWGLRRVRVADRFDTCVEFDDGVGGTYSLCVHDDLVRYGQEPPG